MVTTAMPPSKIPSCMRVFVGYWLSYLKASACSEIYKRRSRHLPQFTEVQSVSSYLVKSGHNDQQGANWKLFPKEGLTLHKKKLGYTLVLSPPSF